MAVCSASQIRQPPGRRVSAQQSAAVPGTMAPEAPPSKTIAAAQQPSGTSRSAKRIIRCATFPSILTGIGSALRQRMISLLEQGGEAVYDPSGRMVIGVYSDGPIAGSRVYTGRPMLDPDRNSDPEERAARPPAASSGDQQSSATNTAVDSASASVGAPAPPGDSPVDTSTEEAADARRARGRQTTIATSPRGLLTPARTRRRSLMAGLIR